MLHCVMLSQEIMSMLGELLNQADEIQTLEKQNAKTRSLSVSPGSPGRVEVRCSLIPLPLIPPFLVLLLSYLFLTLLPLILLCCTLLPAALLPPRVAYPTAAFAVIYLPVC